MPLWGIGKSPASLTPADGRGDHRLLYWLAVLGLVLLAALAIGALGGH
jgi:hypothetical protein